MAAFTYVSLRLSNDVYNESSIIPPLKSTVDITPVSELKNMEDWKCIRSCEEGSYFARAYLYNKHGRAIVVIAHRGSVTAADFLVNDSSILIDRNPPVLSMPKRLQKA